MKVLIAGGGTAGHINPGIAIAKYIKKMQPDAKILFVGTEKGLETRLVPREGFELKFIKVRGFRRKLSFDTIVAVKELFQGIFEARKIVREFKPDVVIGTGGYVCGPVVFMAARAKIPTLIHEQNAFPGVTNKLLSRYTDAVAVSFEGSEKYFGKAKKLILTGNPIRSEMLNLEKVEARKTLGIDKDRQLVVIFGGSRGAERVNEAVGDMILKHFSDSSFNLIFATGEKMYDKIKTRLKDLKSERLQLLPYIYDMGNVMVSADLVVCRAGAITISELTALGIPSLMIPSPYVTANHQEHNARALEAQGAAKVVLEKDLSGDILYREINDLLFDKAALYQMAKNAKKTGKINATNKIYEIMQDIINKKRK